MRIRWMASLAVCLLLGSACTGDEGGGNGGSGSNYGGYVTVDPDFGDGSAEFFSAFSGPDRSDVNGECLELSDLVFDSTHEDVGPTFTMTGGAAPITFDRIVNGDEIHYETSSSDVALDTDYEVSIGAEVLGTLTTPATVLASASYAGGTVTWTAMGADEATIAVVDQAFENIWICYTSDSGSFSLSSDVLAAVPTGLITITLQHVNEVDHNGRTVRLTSSSGPDSIDF